MKHVVGQWLAGKVHIKLFSGLASEHTLRALLIWGKQLWVFSRDVLVKICAAGKASITVLAGKTTVSAFHMFL